MNPRTLAIAIALAAAVTTVGFAVWLARPMPPPPSRPVLPEPVLPSPPSPELDFDREEFQSVVLSDGTPLSDVPMNCAPDDAGSLDCRDLCASDAACPSGSLCVANPDFGYRECLPSRRLCSNDGDCRSSSDTCHVVDTSASGVAVRRCVPRGTLGAGGRCSAFAVEERDICAPGLTCNLDVCGPRCDVRKPGTCSAGWECAPGRFRVMGSCVPSCRDRPCPQGQRCAPDYAGGIPMCHPFIGRACEDDAPCPTGQDCLFGFAEPSLETQAFECRVRCDEGQRCAKGMTCDARSGYCLRPCASDTDCAAPERCHVLNPRSGQKGCSVVADGLPGRPGR